MKTRVHFLPLALVSVVLLLGVFGCQQANKELYSPPPWLGGSNIETLEKAGNYSIYLKLMAKANYTEPITKQLFTLMVPNDDAFKKYFAENGIADVDALTKDQAVNLFTLHMLTNPRSRYQMIYEYLWSEEQGPRGEYAALFFRKPTRSTSQPYYEVGRYGPEKDKKYLMYTGEKLVPLFTIDYFEDFFGALDGSDYTFMYPDSKWNDNMNWGNAMVLDDPEWVADPKQTLEENQISRRNSAARRTSNGFIFYLDRVMDQTESLEQYMQAHPEKYGVYYDMLQRFAKYTSPKVFIDRGKEVGYMKNYDLVSNIAEEQGAFTGNEVRMKDMYSAYVPNNEVLNDYLNKNVLNTYANLDSVPEVTLYYILQTQLGRSLGLISKISKSYFNSFGDPLVINKSDIKSARMCSNGVVYEMNKVLEPNVFKTVPGALFFNSNYSTMLYCLNQAGVLASLSNPNQGVTLLASTNNQLYKYGIRYNKISSKVEYRGSEGLWKGMKTIDLTMFCEDHVYNGVMTDFKSKGYLEMSSGNFVSFQDDKIAGPENQFLKDNAAIVDTKPNDVNGMLYYIDNPIKSKYVMGKFFTTTPEVSLFKDALVKSKLLNPRLVDATTKDTIPTLTFLNESSYWTALAPNNEAMIAAKAAGLIPTETEALKKFLLNHFIRKNAIFDNGGNPKNGMGVTGTYDSNRILATTTEGTTYVPLKIVNVENNLTVEDVTGQVITIDHAKANYLTQKGVAHIITSVLKFK